MMYSISRVCRQEKLTSVGPRREVCENRGLYRLSALFDTSSRRNPAMGPLSLLKTAAHTTRGPIVSRHGVYCRGSTTLPQPHLQMGHGTLSGPRGIVHPLR